MVRKLLIILFALLIPLDLFAQDISPWHAPTEDELGNHAEWRKDDPNHYLLIKADFDGDNEEDTARLVVHDKENKMGILVTLSSLAKTGPLLIAANNDKRAIQTIGIKVAKPGEYKTACGKGYYDCKKDEPEQIRFDRPGIDFFKYESANMYFLWNGDSKSFYEIYISD
jgi:hypothetical protein